MLMDSPRIEPTKGGSIVADRQCPTRSANGYRLQNSSRAVLVVEAVGDDPYFAACVYFDGRPGIGSVSLRVEGCIRRARIERRSPGTNEDLPGRATFGQTGLHHVEDVLVPAEVSGLVLLDHIPEQIAVHRIVIQT